MNLIFILKRIQSNLLKKKIKKKNIQKFNEFKNLIKTKKFTTFWFLNNLKVFDYFLPADQNKKFNYLEIGCFEGMSTLYILNYYKNSNVYCVDVWKNTKENKNFLQYNFEKIEKNFDDNLINFNFNKNKKDSITAIREYYQSNIKFDYIYIDGSHIGTDILIDAIESYKILNNNGILIFDDIDVSVKNKILNPINAVKIFCKLFKNSLNILYFKRLVVIKKK